MGKRIKIYTDGSYNHFKNIGAWAAIIVSDGNKVYLNGIENDSSHNRMELLAVINALNFLSKQNLSGAGVEVFTDSQYVAGIPTRKSKLEQQGFLTRKNKEIRNLDLIKALLEKLAILDVALVKVKAHQKKEDVENLNRDVDKLVRRMVREKKFDDLI